jgi:hypothetical protein
MSEQRDEKDAEGPQPGSQEMQNLVSEAEGKAEDNTASQASREQDQQLEQGSENTS